MKRNTAGLLTLLLAATTALAAPPERWLHVRVVSTGNKGETVRVNVPLALAEKVLPAIQSDKLRGGKVKISGKMGEIDLRTLFDAIRTAPDNEFVTVDNANESVRIAKAGGNLLIKVRESQGSAEKVDVKVPLPVVEAMLSGGKDELDVVAGLRALQTQADTELITVRDGSETVRIWTDRRNTSE